MNIAQDRRKSGANGIVPKSLKAQHRAIKLLTGATHKTTKMSKTIKQQKKPENQFRVIPNLSLKGKDILTRLKNKSLKLDHEGQYSIQEEIDATRRMSKLDIMDKAQQNKKSIDELNKKIQSHSKPK